ncbi:MAG: DUF4878 domain-containing protein [Candidatus Cloacimonetes bacterium]|jgi:hypothetical protein|nr:DUF4878 domain-containing protein [Candidatus Cloacimonadota bacterium]
MKKLFYIFLIAVTLMALTACGPKAERDTANFFTAFVSKVEQTAGSFMAVFSSKAEKSAKAFFKAIEHSDFTSAKEHTTEQGQQLLGMFESLTESMSDAQKAEMNKTKHKILKTVVEGDSAIVTFEQWETDAPEDKNVHELKMKKIDGAWKVDLAKEDLNK